MNDEIFLDGPGKDILDLQAELARLREEKQKLLEAFNNMEAWAKDYKEQRDRLRDILDSPLGRATFPHALKETT